MDILDSLFLGNILFQLCWMTAMYVVYAQRRNGSMVDFGWPSGFFLMALAHLVLSEGCLLRRSVICGMYLIAGARFMFGWLKRGHLTKEDPRWKLWRELWSSGNGLFGIKNEYINAWTFFHAQSLANALIFVIPLQIVCANKSEGFGLAEIIGVVLWVMAFVVENKADMQRVQFLERQKRENKPPGAVLKSGLWAYSRHPNYFCEFLVWVAYTIYALPSVQSSWRAPLLLLVPVCAYYFLVKFTGIYITDKAMLEKRKGTVFEAEIREYFAKTSPFFPSWSKVKEN